MTRMTFSQYAAYRGVSQPAVSKAVQTGRIRSYRDEQGTKYVLKEEADAMWKARTSTAHQTVKLVQPLAPKEKPIETSAPPTEEAPEIPVPEPDPEPHVPNRASDPDLPKGVPPMHHSRAIKEAFMARAAKLSYEAELGKYVSSEDVEKAWGSIISLVKTKVLGIPARIRQRYPELEVGVQKEIEAAVRDALEEISNADN